MLGGGSSSLLARTSNLALLVGAALCSPAIAHASDDEGKPANDQVQTQRRSVTMSVPLVWSGGVLGDVVIEAGADDAVSIEARTLRNELGRLLTDAGTERLDQAIAGDPFITPAELKAAGFDLEFDMSALELRVLSIDPGLRPIQSLQRRIEETTTPLPTIEPADFSAYLNTNVNLTYDERDGFVPPEVFLFGAARYRNVVLEFDGGFAEDFGDSYRFYRRAARAVYDEPESYRRWSAGDLQLNTPGILRAPLIGGIAVEKSRRVFDPFTPLVNFGGRQILLTSPSTVEVIVNGASYQTLDLQPGTYGLDDLPIQVGSNDVQLVVRDAAGREQVTRFDYFFDPIELEAGEDEYTAAVGVSASEFNFQPNYSNDPVFVGNYRKALSDTLIIGGALQVSQDVQVVGAEAQFVPQKVPGSFDLEGAVSTGDGLGFAVRGGYRLITGTGSDAMRLATSFDYQSKNFSTVSDVSRFKLERLSLSATLSKALSERTAILGGLNYFSQGGSQDQKTIFVDVNHTTRNNIRLTLGAEYGSGPNFGSNFGVRAGISLLFGGRHRADAMYQSRRNLARASLSRGADNTVGSLGYSVNVQSSDGTSSVDGLVDYVGNRFEARASLASTGSSFGAITNNQTARLQVGTSFAFADGAFGIGRPIQNSFFLARPHETLEDTDVIIGRSLTDGSYEASSGVMGAAVVGRLSPYSTQDVLYDIDTLEAGYDIGSGVARVNPPYRAGYGLIVGTERFVSAVGFLKIDGSPAGLAVGLITSEDDKGFEPEPFFTNSAGRFGMIGLAPGRTYNIRLNGSDQIFTIQVPEDNKGLYRLGTIDLRTEEE